MFIQTYWGIRKVFAAQIVLIVGIAAVLAYAFAVVVPAAMNIYSGDSYAPLYFESRSILIALMLWLVMMVNYIMTAAGLSQASHDGNKKFRIAFIATIAGIFLVAIEILATLLGSEALSLIVSLVSYAASIVAFVCTVLAIAEVARELNDTSVVSMSKAIIVLFCIGVLCIFVGYSISVSQSQFVEGVYTSGQTPAMMTAIAFMMLGVILMCVSGITYLVYLWKAQAMLKAANPMLGKQPVAAPAEQQYAAPAEQQNMPMNPMQ